MTFTNGLVPPVVSSSSTRVVSSSFVHASSSSSVHITTSSKAHSSTTSSKSSTRTHHHASRSTPALTWKSLPASKELLNCTSKAPCLVMHAAHLLNMLNRFIAMQTHQRSLQRLRRPKQRHQALQLSLPQAPWRVSLSGPTISSTDTTSQLDNLPQEMHSLHRFWPACSPLPSCSRVPARPDNAPFSHVSGQYLVQCWSSTERYSKSAQGRMGRHGRVPDPSAVLGYVCGERAVCVSAEVED